MRKFKRLGPLRWLLWGIFLSSQLTSLINTDVILTHTLFFVEFLKEMPNLSKTCECLWICWVKIYIIYSYENAFDTLLDRFYQVKSYEKSSGNSYSGTRCTRGCPSVTVSVTFSQFSLKIHTLLAVIEEQLKSMKGNEIKITSSTCNFFLDWKKS